MKLVKLGNMDSNPDIPTLPNVTHFTKAQIAEALLRLKGKPLRMIGYKPFEMVYNISPKESTLKAGRQIGKSLCLGGRTVSESVLRPYFNTLYVAPISIQTRRFSNAYINPLLNSPLIKRHFLNSASRRNVLEKSLNNESRMYLAYAETEEDADRVRGASADQLLLDEIQDMSIEALPILGETLSASDYGNTMYAGTAKTENNTLEIKWKASNMMEWVVKCTHCGKYTIPLDFEDCMKIVGNVDGPACIHCGKIIDMESGTWAAGRPQIRDHIGFHLPQFIIGARCTPTKWKDLRAKAFGTEGGEPYSVQKLANEVFGLASGVGGRILSLKEAMACCNSSKTEFDKEFPRDNRNILRTVLGVDWSVSGSTKSYTVITILGYDSQHKCYLLHTERLNGTDILVQVARVIQLYHQFKCSMMGSDRGVGVLQAQLIQKDLGADKVHMVQYCASKNQLRWDKPGGYFAADRTMNIDTVVLRAKMGPTRFETPSWNLMMPFWSDALNVFEEETQAGRRVYRKDPDLTDDWLHSVVFATIADMVLREDFVYLEDGAVPNPAELDNFDF